MKTKIYWKFQNNINEYKEMVKNDNSIKMLSFLSNQFFSKYDLNDFTKEKLGDFLFEYILINSSVKIINIIKENPQLLKDFLNNFQNNQDTFIQYWNNGLSELYYNDNLIKKILNDAIFYNESKLFNFLLITEICNINNLPKELFDNHATIHKILQNLSNLENSDFDKIEIFFTKLSKEQKYNYFKNNSDFFNNFNIINSSTEKIDILKILKIKKTINSFLEYLYVTKENQNLSQFVISLFNSFNKKPHEDQFANVFFTETSKIILQAIAEELYYSNRTPTVVLNLLPYLNTTIIDEIKNNENLTSKLILLDNNIFYSLTTLQQNKPENKKSFITTVKPEDYSKIPKDWFFKPFFCEKLVKEKGKKILEAIPISKFDDYHFIQFILEKIDNKEYSESFLDYFPYHITYELNKNKMGTYVMTLDNIILKKELEQINNFTPIRKMKI